jgi:hypothetical protein
MSHVAPSGAAPADATRGAGDDAALVAVVPVTYEPPDIGASLERYRRGLAPLGRPLRFVVVLDGPRPRALERLRDLRREGAAIEILALPHPLGEAAALAVGLGHAGAGTVLTLPVEPQTDPAELPRLVAALDGCDMVVAARGGDAGLGREGKLDWLLRRLFDSPFRDVRSAVRAMRGEVAAELNPYGNQHHFLPLIAQSQGFTVREIAAGPATGERRRGRRLGLDWSVLLDVLTIWFLLRFIRKPFRFFGGIGFAVLALGGLATLWLVAVRLLWGVPLADRPALILSTLMIVLGLQIISVGLIGEIITFTWARELKDYRVERVVE